MLFTIIAVVILCALIAAAAVSIAKRATQGCCGAGGGKEKRIEKDGSEFKYVYIITVGGMSCKNCAVRIENAFNRQEGIAASVDFKSARAVVRAKEPVTELMLRKTICDNGYTVKEIRSEC